MATFTLPNQGDEPWDLNPAINAINDEVEQTTDLVTTGRLSASSLSSSFATAAQGAKADAAIPTTQKGAASGVAALDSSSKLLETNVPERLQDANLKTAFTMVKNVRGPLFAIDKAASAPYRVLAIGTSIANNSNSPIQRMNECLKLAFGDSQMRRQRAGLLGGSYTNTIDSWSKQPFSGVSYVRMRGTSSATVLAGRFSGYGDELLIEWSREADGAVADVLVDGVSVGSVGGAGPQKFGMQTSFTMTKGYHRVSIVAPATGYFYLEAVEFRTKTRRGVEIIDGTYGGSMLYNAVVAPTQTGSQVAPVTTVTGSGIEALFGRTDVDLIIETFTVNDAGNPAAAAAYAANLERGIITAQRNNTPVVLVIEPAGHYAMPNDNGSGVNFAAYASIKAAKLALADKYPHVWVADWDTPTRIADIPTYAATFYAVTNLNVSAGTYSGDFIHPTNAGNPTSMGDQGMIVLADAMQLDRAVIIDADSGVETAMGIWAGTSRVALPRAIGAASRVPDLQPQMSALYRDTTGTNLRPALNTTIASAGTSDTYGKYLQADAGTTLSLGTESGTRILTIRVGPATDGIFYIRRGSTAVHFYDPEGVEMTAPSGTVEIGAAGGVLGEAPVWLAIPLSQDSSNQTLSIKGRIYEAIVTALPIPLAVAAP